MGGRFSGMAGMAGEADMADIAMRAVRAGVTVAAVVACGGGGEPGPIPQIDGLYTGTWSLAVEDDRASCPAALTISDQVDSMFATRFEVLRRDGDGVGCIDTIQTGTGVVRANRTITALAESVEPVSCVLEGPNRGLSGTVVDDSLDLSGRYTYQCPLEYTWTMRFSGRAAGAPLPSYPDLRGTYTGSWATLAQGVVVTCPVTMTVSSQVRDDLAATYTLEAAAPCVAQSAQALSGTVTVDGGISVTGTPPVSPGCDVERELSLAGTAADNEVDLLGSYALLCGGILREFEVSVGVGANSAR
jgi:hypothetical protein